MDQTVSGSVPMPMLSLRDAAKEAGVSKTSILRAIRSGRLSAPRNDEGNYAIDPAELFRAFPPKGTSDHVDQGVSGTQDQSVPSNGAGGPDLVTARTSALEAEIQALKELVRRLDLDKQDLKSERDAWKGQAEATQRLLSVASAPQEAGRSGLFSWLRRSKAA